MIKQRFLFAAAALSLGFSAIPAFAQSPGGDTPSKAGGSATKQACADLKGAAREACLQRQLPRTPGRSEGAAAREGGNAPGRSDEATSRTGVPPAKPDIPLDPTAAGGKPKAGGSSPAK